MAAEGPTEWVWETKLVGRPAGTQHGRSRADDGSSSANLFVPGLKGVKTQARIRDIDEGELTASDPAYSYFADRRAQRPSIFREIAVGVIHDLIDIAVAEATPRLRRRWHEQALPAIRSTTESMWAKIARSRKPNRQAGTAGLAASVGPSPEDERVTMSSEEARQHVIAAVIAKAFSDAQLRMLLNARIEDPDAFLKWQNSLEQFTRQELEDRIALELEHHPSLLDELAQVFRANRNGAGPGIPVRHERSEALPLADGEN
jgi:hypothetical protein